MLNRDQIWKVRLGARLYSRSSRPPCKSIEGVPRLEFQCSGQGIGAESAGTEVLLVWTIRCSACFCRWLAYYATKGLLRGQRATALLAK